MRPSVTMATRRPLANNPDIAGISLCSSGMPLARGPCPRITAMKSSLRPALSAAAMRFLALEHARRRGDVPVFRIDGRGLDDRPAEIAAQQLESAVR